MKKINYSPPFKTQGGAYASLCFHPLQKNMDIYNVPVLIDTPEFIFNGIKTKECKHQKDKLYIEIELKEKTKTFFDFIEKLRNYNIEYSYNNSKEWFSKEISIQEFEKLHPSFIEEKDNSKYIHFYIHYNSEDNFILNIEDIKKNKLNLEDIENKKVKCILKIEKLKFLKKELICDLVIERIIKQEETILDFIKNNNENKIKIHNSELEDFNNEDINNDDNITFINDSKYDSKYKKEKVLKKESEKVKEQEPPQINNEIKLIKIDSNKDMKEVEEVKALEEVKDDDEVKDDEYKIKEEKEENEINKEDEYKENTYENESSNEEEEEHLSYNEFDINDDIMKSVTNLELDNLETIDINLDNLEEIDTVDYNKIERNEYIEYIKQQEKIKELEIENYKKIIEENEKEKSLTLNVLNEKEKNIDNARLKLQELTMQESQM